MNLHRYYYKEYFNRADFHPLLERKDATLSDISEKNNFLCSPNLLCEITKNPIVNHVISLKIAYPGLVTGVGINHEANIKGEFKLGVHFDWTYGMPVVYGSSVKGVLRSYFKDFYSPKEGQPSADDAIDDIFNGGKKSIYDRDIFFDAVITKADSKGRILCSDSITPHNDDPLKNPIPITFLKIAPGCTMEFRFKLVDTKIGNKELKKEDKLNLFKEILTTIGIGAKTNVGYGQLL